MFEGLRKQTQSFMLVILIASLAAIFGTQWGPGARGCNQNSLRVNHIARVYGNTISEQDFQSLARLTGLSERQNARVLRQAIVDGLIERELLAREAERLGYSFSEDDLNREIRDGYYYISLGSREIDQLAGPFGGGISARSHTSYSRSQNASADSPAPAFNYDDFENWVRGYFGRTVPDYKRMMAREMLAEAMRNVVVANVRVSEDEVWRDYQRQHEQVAIRYIRFSPDFYRDVVRDSDQAALDAFAQSHQEEINRQWEQRRESLQHLPAQYRIRQILLRFPDGAEEPTRIATQQRAEELRRRIAGGEDFVRLARLYSQDESNWRTAGETSWLPVDRIDAPDDVKRVIPTLQPGQVSDVIRSPLGVHIVQLVARREGDVPEADAKRDIARDLYRITRGNELAVEAANHAQQLLQAPGANLDTVAAAIHTAALEAFYRGPVPETITLPGNNQLEVVNHSDTGAPELRETMPFTAGGTVPGIEHSEALARAAFQLTTENPAPSGPVTVGDDRFIVRLKERQSASRDEFNHDRQQLMEEFTMAKRREVLQQYIARLRAAAEREGQVRIGNSPLLQQQNRGREDREAPEQGG
jgi:parvulin-like peptidyl-prolyl isomerase